MSKAVAANQAAGAVPWPDSGPVDFDNPLPPLLALARLLEAAPTPAAAALHGLKSMLRLAGADKGLVYLVDAPSRCLYPACFEGFSDISAFQSIRIDFLHPQWKQVLDGKAIGVDASFLTDGSPLPLEGMMPVVIEPVTHQGRLQACFVVAAYGPVKTLPPDRGTKDLVHALVGGAIARLNAEIQCRAPQTEETGENRVDSSRVQAVEAAGRKIMEPCVRHHSDHRRLMSDIGKDIVAAKSPQAIAEAATVHIQRQICCSHASVVEFDHGKQQAVFLAVRSSVPSKLSRNYEMDKSAFPLAGLSAGHACCCLNPVSVSNPSTFEQVLAQERVQSLMIVPLRYKNDLIGLLNLGSQEPGYFTTDQVEAACEAGLALSIAMRHNRMHKQTLKDAETKAMLLHEMNHRVKNNLSAILGLLFGAKRAARLLHDDRHIALIDNLIGRIQGMATTHRLLSAGQWAPLSLENLSRQVVLACLHALAPGKSVALEVGASDIIVTAKSANTLALILSELSTNSIRHAIGDRAAGAITARTSIASGIVMLEYRDDGPGYPEGVMKEPGSYTGLCLVQALVRNDLRGTLAFQNDGGAVARIRFKPDDPNSKII